MSVAIEVSSPVWVRSAVCAAFSGRSTGEAAPTSSGAAISTTQPSGGDVVNISVQTSANAASEPSARETTSIVWPKVLESEEEMLSTSPVGSRRDNTWPSWTALWVTSFWVP